MRPSATKVIAGGIVGTALITAVMYWVAPLMMGQPMDIAQMLSGMIGTSWTVGMVIHWINGVVIFPLIYAYVVFGILPGGPWMKGAIWGLVLWLIAEAIVIPMAGAGFFHGGMMKPIVGSLMGHLLYGLALGWIAGGAAPDARPAEF